jgi:hypothetical protein
LVSAGGLVPVLALADRVGLRSLAEQHLTVPTDRGAHAGSKVASLVAGMIAGADSIEDRNLLRHGGMARLFTGTYAPSTLGSFLRNFAFGHGRQLDAVAARPVANLGAHTPLLPDASQVAYLDIDDAVRGDLRLCQARAPATATPASRDSTRCWPRCPPRRPHR